MKTPLWFPFFLTLGITHPLMQQRLFTTCVHRFELKTPAPPAAPMTASIIFGSSAFPPWCRFWRSRLSPPFSTAVHNPLIRRTNLSLLCSLSIFPGRSYCRSAVGKGLPPLLGPNGHPPYMPNIAQPRLATDFSFLVSHVFTDFWHFSIHPNGLTRNRRIERLPKGHFPESVAFSPVIFL